MENAVSHFKDRGTYILLAVESTSILHHTLSDGAEVASSPGSFPLSVRGKGPGYEASTEDLGLVPPALVSCVGCRTRAGKEATPSLAELYHTLSDGLGTS